MGHRVNIKDEYRERFYRVPKVFMTNEKYKNLSMNAKMTWAIFRDRTDLSLKNNWIDGNGDVYFVFTYENLMDLLNRKSRTTISKIKKELLAAGLIEEIRQGLNRPNKIYLFSPEVEAEDIYTIIKQENVPLENDSYEFSSKYQDCSLNSKEEQCIQSQTIKESPLYGLPKNEFQEVHKVDPNETDLNEIKEYKDNKDRNTYYFENDLFKETLSQTQGDLIANEALIDHLIEADALNELFGSHLIDLMKVYSFGSYEIFERYSNKLLFAFQEAESELGKSIDLIENIYLQEQLVATFLRVIRLEKQGKIENSLAGYLFISFKNVFLDCGTQQTYQSELKLPMHNWLLDT